MLEKQTSPSDEVMCSNVKHYFKRAAKSPDFTARLEVSVKVKRSRVAQMEDKLLESAPKLYCSTCDDMIPPNDLSARDHLKYQCRAIPSTPLKPGFTRMDLARRMAAFGSKKKLFKHNFTPH